MIVNTTKLRVGLEPWIMGDTYCNRSIPGRPKSSLSALLIISFRIYPQERSVALATGAPH